VISDKSHDSVAAQGVMPWWAIQLSLIYVFIAKFGNEKIPKSVNAWQSYRQKGRLSCVACSHCNDPV